MTDHDDSISTDGSAGTTDVSEEAVEVALSGGPVDEAGDDAAPGTVDAPRRRRTWPALVAFVVPILLAVGVMVVLAGRGDGGGSSSGAATANVPVGEEYRYVIPAGTAYKMRNNQPVVDIMPELVTIKTGDIITVENRDDATHTFGPITVRAGETLSMPFTSPGYYFGLCTAGTHSTITIQVA